MNIHSSQIFEETEKELSNLINLIKEIKNDDININLFENTLNIWKKYREDKAKFDASNVEGGTMYPLIYTNSLTITTKEKIKSLRKEFEIDLKKHINENLN